MPDFVGRDQELGELNNELNRVTRQPATGEPGRCLMVRGRRRVGKSRLIEEFLARAGVPAVFFTAARQGAREPARFAQAIVESTLPGRAMAGEVTPQNWEGALGLVVGALPANGPAVVVIDEFPYLVEQDSSIEAIFQKVWDRTLAKQSVLLILIGSDLAMMEALNSYGRAFYQRGREVVVAPLSPRAVATIVQAPTAADAFDAYLVTGGLPLVCTEWERGKDLWTFLEAELAHSTSPLIVSAERSLAAEFPDDALARAVLEKIGSGETTFTNIARAAGGLQATSLTRALGLLAEKRIVARDLPLSTKPSRESRYRIVDPYLRFWLTFIGPRMAEIERRRSDLVLDRIRSLWSTWRGKAIEPVIREAMARLVPIAGLPPANAIGGWWPRNNAPEIDIVGADRQPVANSVSFAGTIKWQEHSPLTQAQLNQLRADVTAVPGANASTVLVAVSRSGVSAKGAAVTLGPEDLIEAW